MENPDAGARLRPTLRERKFRLCRQRTPPILEPTNNPFSHHHTVTTHSIFMNTPAYSKRVLAFVDVLGFRALINQSSECKTREREIIKRVSDAIDWSIEELAEISNAGTYSFTHFSDSFVVSVESSSNHRFAFQYFTLALLHIINCFLGSELLLRGGVTRGMLIHNERLLFGPAMNRAYDLESKIAKYPRIILDPTIPDLQNMLVLINSVVAIDSDSLMYIDYFTPRDKAFYLVPERWLFLQRTIEAIPLTVELQEKRAWMINKYNEAISGFSYSAFKARFDEYVYDTDNNSVERDYRELLNNAAQIRKL